MSRQFGDTRLSFILDGLVRYEFLIFESEFVTNYSFQRMPHENFNKMLELVSNEVQKNYIPRPGATPSLSYLMVLY